MACFVDFRVDQRIRAVFRDGRVGPRDRLPEIAPCRFVGGREPCFALRDQGVSRGLLLGECAIEPFTFDRERGKPGVDGVEPSAHLGRCRALILHERQAFDFERRLFGRAG